MMERKARKNVCLENRVCSNCCYHSLSYFLVFRSPERIGNFVPVAKRGIVPILGKKAALGFQETS
jgi:hypothetical protein